MYDGAPVAGYTGPVEDRTDEIAFYRAVEDFFASLRGVPHALSPKDFQLLRAWWREGVPLLAVTSGVTEVFERRRERGDEDPVVSLSYCRHAVRSHARRLAEARVGASDDVDEVTAPSSDLASLVVSLRSTAAELEHRLPAASRAVAVIADRVDDLAPVEGGVADQHLFSLEAALLETCWKALPPEDRDRITGRVDDLVAGSGASPEAAARSRRALRDRELRRLLHLPRLEVGEARGS